MLDTSNKKALAYIIGVSMGDGNLSNSNGRAVRLRITCDKKYPNIIKSISSSLNTIAPNNKVSLVKRKDNCIDVSCYSNDWEKVLGWKVGSKAKQNMRIPSWINKNKIHQKACLKGLFETDGSIYIDRKYITVNFVTIVGSLAGDVLEMIKSFNFEPNLQIVNEGGNKKTRYNIRISKKAKEFIDLIDLDKS